MMTCTYVDERRLFELAEGQLTGLTRDVVAAHVSTCRQCRDTVGQYHEIGLALRIGVAPPKRDTYDPWAPVRGSLVAADPLVFALADAIVLRSGLSTRSLVSKHLGQLASLAPGQPNAAIVLGYFAAWLTELGLGHLSRKRDESSYIDLVESVLRPFRQAPRGHWTAAECLHVELATAMVALHAEDYTQAIVHLKSALVLSPHVGDTVLAAVINGAASRAYARLGKYQSALKYARRGIDIAYANGFQELAAAHEVRKAWVLFQRLGPRSREAWRLFEKANDVLEGAEDCVALGNITAAKAKMFAHRGKYLQAIKLYESAVGRYGECDADHPNLARALVNQAQASIQAVRRQSRVGQISRKHREFEALFDTASKNLDRANAIYQRNSHFRGRGSVLLVRAFWHLTTGQLDAAAESAKQAFELGRTAMDRILKARARIQQCRIALDMSVTGGDNVYLEDARHYAEEAVELVNGTQHRRLRAVSRVCLGLTLVHPHCGARAEAEQLLSEARLCLRKGTDDYISDELVGLDIRLAGTGGQEDGTAPVAPARIGGVFGGRGVA